MGRSRASYTSFVKGPALRKRYEERGEHEGLEVEDLGRGGRVTGHLVVALQAV
jgi:hypothetical protein